MTVGFLPHLVAALNALAAILVCAGFWFQRRGQLARHRTAMTAAVSVSAAFLAVYLVHHGIGTTFAFPGTGIERTVYFTMLASHVVLAALVTPLVLMTFLRARAGAVARHRALARWTFPVWLYVSLTGIAVYVWLYHVHGRGG